MRIAPVSLFCHNQPQEKLIELVTQATLLTHTHQMGINGAILQALAIHKAFNYNANTNGPLDVQEFIKHLQNQMILIEKDEEG